MKPAEERTLQARRTELCAQLQAQRLLIAQQLGVASGPGGGYPRSRTMRLLTGRPELFVRLLGGLTRLIR